MMVFSLPLVTGLQHAIQWGGEQFGYHLVLHNDNAVKVAPIILEKHDSKGNDDENSKTSQKPEVGLIEPAGPSDIVKTNGANIPPETKVSKQQAPILLTSKSPWSDSQSLTTVIVGLSLSLLICMMVIFGLTRALAYRDLTSEDTSHIHHVSENDL